MYTNTTRMTGLSGIDTQSMIDKLMKAESAKLYKYQKSTQLLDWKQTAYREQAKTIRSFSNDFLSFTTNSATNMRSKNAYTSYSSTVKTSTGADSSAVNITSSSGSKTGDMKLKVLELAKTDVNVSGEIQGNIKSTDIIDISNLKANDNFNITLDGVSKNVKFSDTEVATIANDKDKFAQILNTKLNTLFGEEGPVGETVQKIEVKNNVGILEFSTIKGHTASISEGTGRDTSVKATGDVIVPGAPSEILFNVQVGVDSIKPVTLKLEAGMDVNKYAAAVNAGLKEAGVTNLSAAVVDGKISLRNLNSDQDVKITGATDAFTNLGMDASLNGELTILKSNFLADLKIKSGTTDSVDVKKTVGEVFGKTGDFNFDINGVNITLNGETDTVQSMLDKVNKSGAGVVMSFDNLNRQFKIESKNTGASNNVTGSYATELGFTNQQKASDSLIEFNGIKTSRDSNNIELNGIKMQLNAVTTDELNISVSNDTTKTMDNIKKFVEGYNKMIESINKEVKTNVAKKNGARAYQPLTDDEKKAMKDTELASWEAKAKEGLLYNDDILRKITSDMRSQLYSSLELENGSKISLYDIGIDTSKDYKDGGKLVIDEAKLSQAIEERGNDIAELFTKSSTIPYSDKKNSAERMKTQGLAERLNDLVENAIGSSGTIAKKAGIKDTLTEGQNDMLKELTSQYKKMTELRSYLARKEEYYYSMFSKMESAVSKSNNEMAYLTSQLG